MESEGSLLLPGTPDDTHFWVVGDVHGSLSAIAKVWAYILHEKKKGGRHVLVFLGDVLDRGKEDLETLAFVLSLIMEEREDVEVLYIAGNHDVGLELDEADGVFTSSVRPAETKDRLNKPVDEGGGYKEEGVAAKRLASRAPRMIEIAGLDSAHPARTVMLMHGGVPHIDRQEELAKCKEEIKKACGNGKAFLPSIPGSLRELVAEDYTWLRLSDNLPHKRPNRNSKGCEIGTADVNAYRRLHEELTGRAITCIIRGHDHERKGYRIYSYHKEHNKQASLNAQRECHVLTLNTMEATEGEGGLFRERRVAFAHLQSGSDLRILTLPSTPALYMDSGENNHQAHPEP